MALFSLPLSLRDIVLGQSLLVACCLVYLAWWCVAFRPGVAAGGWLGYALLAGTMVLAGVVAGVLLRHGAARARRARDGIRDVAARAVTVRATMVALHGGFAGRMASD